MTIDHDAIAARVRNFLTTGQIFGIREVMSAYLDLHDEVKRLRADLDQGALDYCDLMTRHDAHFVAWQSAKSRAEKAEAERERLLYVLDGVAGAIDTGRNEPLQVWRDQINIARQALKGGSDE